MEQDGLIWIYLIFLLIPLSRILPRLVKKYKKKNSVQQSADTPFLISDNKPSKQPSEKFDTPQQIDSKPRSTSMLVLGELQYGTKNFDQLQQKLEVDTETLNSVLEDLEKKGFMRVEQKKGFLGPKIELYVTDEGIKKYHS